MPIKGRKIIRSRWTALSFAAVFFIAASVTANAGPLHDAVKDGDIAGLRDLIAVGEDLEAQDRFVGTALHWAALTGNAKAALELIVAGADVNRAPDVDPVFPTTPLENAIARGWDEIADMLRAAGATE